MNVTDEINNYVRDVGKGSMRDALNLALATIQRLEGELAYLRKRIDELIQDAADATEDCH